MMNKNDKFVVTLNYHRDRGGRCKEIISQVALSFTLPFTKVFYLVFSYRPLFLSLSHLLVSCGLSLVGPLVPSVFQARDVPLYFMDIWEASFLTLSSSNSR